MTKNGVWGMKAFQWGSYFVTDLKDIDAQHQRLADHINRIGDLLNSKQINKEQLDALIEELVDFTSYHFTEEEELMARLKVDPRHVEKHIKIHRKVISDIISIYPNLDINSKKQTSIYFNYLVLCVQHHIVTLDKDMSNQIKNIQSGMSPQQAYHYHENGVLFNISESLIEVLHDIFIQVEGQRKSLEELNESLEDKVADRTKALSESNKHLEKLSLTDPLTNIPNRRHAIQTLSIAWQEAIQKDRPLTCFMIDVDNFKQINDDFGHDTGDIVLIELTETIYKQLHCGQLLCRLGGDEFILICPNTNKSQAQKIAGTILNQIKQLEVKNHVEEWNCSISIGGACRNAEMKDYEQLMKAADNALYNAKTAGKNCIKF